MVSVERSLAVHPLEEIEYMTNFVEADTENDLYEISEAVMGRVKRVREWIKSQKY